MLLSDWVAKHKSASAAADELGVSRQTLRYWVGRGAIIVHGKIYLPVPGKYPATADK